MLTNSLSKNTLSIIEECRRAGLKCETGPYRVLKREAVRAVRTGEDAKIHGVCEVMMIDVCLSLETIYQLSLALPSKESGPCYFPALQRKQLMGHSDIRARWPGYFEELNHMDQLDREFPGNVTAFQDAVPQSKPRSNKPRGN